MDASATMQEYLAEAYRIAYYQDDQDRYVSTSALARVLDVTAPAVTRMVQRLKEAGYLEYEPYRGILLTKKGETEALMCIRRHRLVERFLTDVMGFGWHEVHGAADELGAVVSDKVVARMEVMAGYPRRCPHGEPIPWADGRIPQVVDYPLNEVRLGQEYFVSRVNTHDEAMLKYFDNLGVRPGVVIHLIDRAPFNGPLQMKIGETVHFIGHELAVVMRVCSQEEYELV